MAETILPDVYIEVRPEGLIVPTQINIGRVGMVGTAGRGPLNTPVVLADAGQARQMFGAYDPWVDGASDELTLVRGLELAFACGASTVFAVRVAGAGTGTATLALASATGTAAVLTATSPGTWANDLTAEVGAADQSPFLSGEEHIVAAGPVTLGRGPIIRSARNSVRRLEAATGITTRRGIVYKDANVVPPEDPAPGPGQVKLDLQTGELTFGAPAPVAGDTVTASYAVAASAAVQVTLTLGAAKERYTVVDGADLVADITANSDWVTAAPGSQPAEVPSALAPAAPFSGGQNGESGADYQEGLDPLLAVDAHIIVAAGQDAAAAGVMLDAHCQNASTDTLKRDRIGVVGTGVDAETDDILGASNELGSDRIVLVGPGIVVRDAAAEPPVDVTLPGAFAAAAVAGLIAGLLPHQSPTNKVLRVPGVDPVLPSPELALLVQGRVLALTARQGVRVVKGITTATLTAFAQITTRRIVDYAKYGVRSAASPYIGLLNNERVRAALRASVNSFLAQMVLDEMLVSYDLAVTATRDEERQGIARVTMTLRPTFSIDYIKVTMFLE